MNRFERMFVRGALRIPGDFAKKNAFRAASTFAGPRELILSGYCTPVENQGSKPWCAAYSASSYAENILWRRRGYHKDIDPEPLYRHAKTIDGDPDGDGTYLECTLKALLAKGYFDKDRCRVKTISGSIMGFGSGLNDVKYAIHKYGACLGGFNISSEWFSPRNGVVSGKVKDAQGGHAVVICGYDEGGVLVLNSWGRDYGHDGFVYLTNRAFDDSFMYGALLSNVLDD